MIVKITSVKTNLLSGTLYLASPYPTREHEIKDAAVLNIVILAVKIAESPKFIILNVSLIFSSENDLGSHTTLGSIKDSED